MEINKNRQPVLNMDLGDQKMCRKFLRKLNILNRSIIEMKKYNNRISKKFLHNQIKLFPMEN